MVFDPATDAAIGAAAAQATRFAHHDMGNMIGAAVDGAVAGEGTVLDGQRRAGPLRAPDHIIDDGVRSFSVHRWLITLTVVSSAALAIAIFATALILAHTVALVW